MLLFLTDVNREKFFYFYLSNRFLILSVNGGAEKEILEYIQEKISQNCLW